MGSGPQLIGCNQQQAQEVEQDQPVCPGSSGNWTQIPSVRVSWGRCGRETCSQSEWVSETTDLIVQRYFSSAQFQLCLLSVSIFSTVAAQFEVLVYLAWILNTGLLFQLENYLVYHLDTWFCFVLPVFSGFQLLDETRYLMSLSPLRNNWFLFSGIL